MDIRVKFGRRIRKLRLEKKISQEKLAHLADLDRTYIPGIERGERNVSLVVIDKLAKALKVQPKDLLD